MRSLSAFAANMLQTQQIQNSSSSQLQPMDQFKTSPQEHLSLKSYLSQCFLSYTCSPSRGRASPSTPKFKPSTSKEMLIENNAMLSKIYIFRQIRSELIRSKIPILVTTLETSDICLSLDVDQEFNGELYELIYMRWNPSNESTFRATINWETNEVPSISYVLHKDCMVGINATTHTIFLDLSEYKITSKELLILGTPIPHFDGLAPFPEIRRSIGIDEFLVPIIDNPTNGVSS